MTTAVRREPTPPALEPCDSIPIAQLTPDSAASSSYLVANVVLVWPYSSSTDSLALLLADPDIRLRKHRGQAKVVFRDGAAREIAKTKVGIGDTVKLSLLGCDWKETSETVSTPGKKIDWDLEFSDRVVFRFAGDGDERASVNYTRRVSTSPPMNVATTPSGSLQTPRAQLNGVRHEQSTPQVYLTPFKSTRKYSGGTFIDASLEPFAEDDGYILGKGRKRTKFARHSGAWNLVGSEAPEEQRPVTQTASNDAEPTLLGVSSPEVDVNVAPDKDGRTDSLDEQPREPDITSKDAIPSSPTDRLPEHQAEKPSSPRPSAETTEQPTLSTSVAMGPPQTPLRTVAIEPIREDTVGAQEHREDTSFATTTPQLLPLASPGLPLVSPFLRRSVVEAGYFPWPDGLLSQLEPSGEDRTHLLPRQNAAVVVDSIAIESEEMSPGLDETTVQGRTPSESQGAEEGPCEKAAHEAVSLKHQDQGCKSPDMSNPIIDVLSTESTAPSGSTLGQAISPAKSDRAPQTDTRADPAMLGIEDDDLYGAPEESPQSSVSSPVVTSPAQPPRFPDALEQSDPMPPTSSNPRSIADSIADVPRSPASEASPAPVISDTDWDDNMTVGAVECKSSDTYPAPPFPFRQNWHKPKGSYSSSRRSSHHSTNQSFDGSVDEEDTSGLVQHDEINDVVPSHSEDPRVARIEIQSVSSEDAMPGTRKESPETVQTESSRDSGAATSDGDSHYVPPYVEEVVENSLSSPLINATTSQEPARQLPTPDQTQRDCLDDGSMLEIGAAHQTRTDPSAPLSPRPTQEESTSVNLRGESQVQVQEESASPAKVIPESEPQAAPTTYQRTSQRLLVKRSAMSVNISSPYFMPRKTAPASLSSPLAQREIPSANPPDQGMSSLLSSPIPEHTKSVVTSVSTNETEQGKVLTEQVEEAEKISGPRNGTITSLSYYPRLAALHEHFGQLVDVMAVCIVRSSESQRSKTGPKDYFTNLRLTDRSLDSGVDTTVQIFRPRENALPKTEPGDAVIMRNFKVQTLNRRLMLLSTETSSWAVFKPNHGVEHMQLEAVVSGPPIEYGQEEASYVKSLVRWWHKEGEEQSPNPITAGQEKEISRDYLAVQETPNFDWINQSARFPRKAVPADRRRENRTDNINNEGEAGKVLVVEDGPDESIHLTDKAKQRRESTVSTTARSVNDVTPRRSTRSRASPILVRQSREREVDDVLVEEGDPDESLPLSDMTNQRRESIVSTTARSVKEFTPRRSTRGQASPSLVHELRDGTKYVDHDRRRSGSVIHELRDGVTYVDE